MRRQAVFPPGFEDTANALGVSPGLISGDHVFLTGTTGSAPDGTMPTNPEAQFRAAFEKIGAVLNVADLGFGSIVEMTTYHVGIHDHFELFNAVRMDYVQPPFPAWTAVEAAGLRRPGALVEIRVIAARS